MSTAHLLHHLFSQDSELLWVKARTNGRSSVEEVSKYALLRTHLRSVR